MIARTAKSISRTRNGKLVAGQNFLVTTGDQVAGLFDPCWMLQHLCFYRLHSVSEIMNSNLMGVDAVFQH
jgi:hypothetical protein